MVGIITCKRLGEAANGGAIPGVAIGTGPVRFRWTGITRPPIDCRRESVMIFMFGVALTQHEVVHTAVRNAILRRLNAIKTPPRLRRQPPIPPRIARDDAACEESCVEVYPTRAAVAAALSCKSSASSESG
jgi:hypothetical protein